MTIESQLILNSLNHQVCIMGNNPSLELKVSRNTLMVFGLGKHAFLIFYEVPYINLKAIGLLSGPVLERQVASAKA